MGIIEQNPFSIFAPGDFGGGAAGMTRLPNGMFNRSIPDRPNWYGSCNMGKPQKTQLI